MQKLLNLDKVPTAVFCSNDDMAVGAMRDSHIMISFYSILERKRQ